MLLLVLKSKMNHLCTPLSLLFLCCRPFPFNRPCTSRCLHLLEPFPCKMSYPAHHPFPSHLLNQPFLLIREQRRSVAIPVSLPFLQSPRSGPRQLLIPSRLLLHTLLPNTLLPILWGSLLAVHDQFDSMLDAASCSNNVHCPPPHEPRALCKTNLMSTM